MDVSILKAFAQSLQATYSLPGASPSEDQLKAPVTALLKEAGAGFGESVECRTETHLSEHKVRPDIAVHVDKLICGYIELKAPGLGADATKLKGPHNQAQWNKLKSIPNLIYTDGREWALYRGGERTGTIIRLDDDPSERGSRAVSTANADALERLLRNFLLWQPIVPHEPRLLARYLAPLTRLLRMEVEDALGDPASAAALLATEWRQYFFPEADDSRFADAYAQTVAYALLLARLHGAEDLAPANAATHLDQNNGVLAVALNRLGQDEAREELRVGFELLQRSLEALDPHAFLEAGPELWLYFYEDFLAAYDPKLRRDYGVYFTPRAVVELQVRLASGLLDERFGKAVGFADDGVVFLDPAVGTGTYLVAAVKHGLAKVRTRYGDGAVPPRAMQMARNMHGFEVLIGPYAVAHLRLTQALEGEGAVVRDRLNIYLCDTLDSPHLVPPGGLTLTYRALTQEHEAARQVKAEGDILVCLGNPPYDRQNIDEDDDDTSRKGGWVRFGDRIEGGAPPERQGQRPLIKDFTEPASEAGAGLHLKNIYNDYVYFWRWALWRLFEQQQCGGIVSFITASSYLGGPGFVGMREAMRRTFDELWIIDLGGDNLGTRPSPNVFNIQTPVAIAIGIRRIDPASESPAAVRYARIEGDTRESKLDQLDHIHGFGELEWLDCPTDWHAAFLPAIHGEFFDWPRLVDLFPYQRSGSKFGRSWPIAESEYLLQERWRQLLSKTGSQREEHFKNNRYRKIHRQYRDHRTREQLPPIADLDASANCPPVSPYAFRSFDRQWAIEDIRCNDRMGDVLWRLQGDAQIYLCSLASGPLGVGQGVIASSAVPDLHCFCGRGGKDVIPLYRDAAGTRPNIAGNLLDTLGSHYEQELRPEDLAAYVYALLGCQAYTRRYWAELEKPGARVPITQSGQVFAEAATLGRRLLWLHTYAQRFRGDGRGDRIPLGTARCTAAVSDDPAHYPNKFKWDPRTRTLLVGGGEFSPVSPEVWGFQVSGLAVVESWLGYRMKRRAGKRSSPLDEIRPRRWTPRFTEELLELLWVLEATLAMEPELSEMLDRVVNGDCFSASKLPSPTCEERRAPAVVGAAGGLLPAMDAGGDTD